MVVMQGGVVRSWTVYILRSDRQIFQNVDGWDPRHNSDHMMVLGCLHRASLRKPLCYLGCRTRPPLRPPGRQGMIWADKVFAEFRRTVQKPYKQVSHHNLCILAET